MKWVILIYLILNPLFYLVGFDQRQAQQLFFQFSSMGVFILSLFFYNREIKRDKLNIVLGVMFILFVLAWIKNQSGWNVGRNFLFGLLVYLSVIRTLKKDDIEFVFKNVLYLIPICIIVLAFQLIGWDFRASGTIGAKNALIAGVQPESIFFHRSSMGMFFAHNIPILVTQNIYLSPLLFIPMYWSQSMAAYFGGAIGLGFFLWFRKRILFWGFLILIIIGIIFGVNSDKVKQENFVGYKQRIIMWSRIVQDTFLQPLGHGTDSFANPVFGAKYYNYTHKGIYEVLKLVKDENGNIEGATDKDKEKFKEYFNNITNVGLTFDDHPHNEYIWLGYEIGIQAWVVLGFIFYFLWEKFRFSKRDTLTCASMAILICFAVESILQFPLHLARVGYLLPVILGFFYITTEE